MKKLRTVSLLLAVLVSAAGCAPAVVPSETAKPTAATPVPPRPTEEATAVPTEEPIVPDGQLVLDATVTHQTWEGFGASGAWWAQDVGGWEEEVEGIAVRDRVLSLLYDPENGIGLDIYRYNLGASTRERASTGRFDDTWRRAESFLTAEGTLDFTRDENAVWAMRKAVDLGATQVVLFSNSAPDQMTVNHLAHGDKPGTTNLAAENYQAFADYSIQVARHFLEEGIPVTQLSPVNEPQWDWTGGQEGCHFTAEELIALYKVFQTSMDTALPEVELSLTESGEWKGNAVKAYITGIMKDEQLSQSAAYIDGHSYWTDKMDKQLFKNWLDTTYPQLKIRSTEWCEMVNGQDETMDSALELAKVVTEDMVYLDTCAWSCWIAVSRYNYRDGLLYVNSSTHKVTPIKRLWAYGNFSRYIQPGAVRIDASTGIKEITAVAFTQPGETVAVLTNSGAAKYLTLPENARLYLTDETHDLEEIENTGLQLIPAESVLTVVVKEA